jgi:uncharacterized protein involved in outer membrane biogenesis
MRLRQHPVLAVIGALVLAIMALVLVWDWNWLNPLVAHMIAKQLGRPVTLARFDIRDIFSRNPLVVLDGITVDNPPNFPGSGQLGTVERLSLRVAAGPLIGSMGRDIVLPEITIEHPHGDLRAGPDGKRNWVFNLPDAKGDSTTSVRLGTLVITDGDFRVNDPERKADLRVKVQTEPPRGGGEPRLVASADGRYAGQPFKGNFTGGSLLSLRDPKKPYPVDLVASAGGTRIALKGTVTDAARLIGANLQLDLAGQDLAQLYPILGIPLAETPPYTLRGRLDYGGNHIKLSDFAGTVGQSDLGGNFDVDRGYQRPLITAELTSRKVVLSDLAGFLGTAPGREPVQAKSPEQQKQVEQRAASPSLLPDEPFNLEKLHAADFRVHYKGDHIEAQWAPLDKIEANLTIDNGKAVLQPLNFTIGHGSIASSLLLDAEQNPIEAKASVDFREVDFHRVMQATKIFEGAGVIGGRAEIDGHGNSPAAIAANGNGELKLFMNGGDVSALVVNLAGLDFGRSLLSALGLPDKTALRCMISDFVLQQGVLKTQNLVVDTDEANVIGHGDVDLRNNSINFHIEQEPKHFSILALHAPIDVTGSLKSPTITPNPGQLGIKAALGAITGLLATVQLGLGKDNNCASLIQSAEQAAQAPTQVPVTPPRKAVGSKSPAPTQHSSQPSR